MTFQLNPYSFPLIVGLIPVVTFVVSAWRHRTNLAARFFLLFAGSVAGFMLTYALELFSATLPMMLFWLRLEYIFSLSAPVFWLLFMLAYARYDVWLTRRNVILLFIIPVLHLLTVWTNQYHGLNWATVGTQTVGNMVLFERTYGPMFWIGTIYLYGVALAATVLMIVFIIRSPNLYREQIAALILSVILIWLGSILTVTGLTLVPHLDLSPFGYALACIPLAWSLFRFRLLEIMPAARDAIMKSMSDAVIVLDAHNRVIDLNPAAEKLTNRKAAEAIGKPGEFLFPANSKLIEQYRDVREAQGELTTGEGANQRHFDLRISPLFDRGGAFSARIIVVRDVTTTKKAEATIRRYASELEERNRELDAFSHTIAHDLKNPLTAIAGFAELILQLEGGNLTPAGKSYLDRISQNGHKMRQMIDDLLLLARLRDVTDAVTEVKMAAVAKAAADRFAVDLDIKKIRLDIMADMPIALGQALWLEEVFANFISNAIKYIGQDNKTPQIAVRGLSQGDVVRFEIQDNGLGIKLEDQPRLFDMFTRFHPGESTGSGLGLTICQRIIERLGGQVGVESAPGKGSTFWFTLPAPSAQVDAVVPVKTASGSAVAV